MNDERPIEKLLRRYAKKRRDDAGAPELHPATRRLLQGEVSRQFRKRDAAGSEGVSFGKILKGWLPWLGWATAIVVVVGIFGLMIFGGHEKQMAFAPTANQNAPVKMAKNEEAADLKADRQARSEAFARDEAATPPPPEKISLAPAVQPASPPAPAPVLADSSPAASTPSNFGEFKKNSVAPAELDREATRARSLVKESPASARADADSGKLLVPQSAVPVAPQKTEAPNYSLAAKDKATFAGGPPTGAAEARRAGAPAGVAGDSLNTKSAPMARGGGFDGQKSYRQDESYSNLSALRYANAVKSSVVLTNFQVEQTGNQVRVIDGDGSVYSGALVGPVGGTEDAKQKTAARAVAPPAAATISQPAQAQNYFYRVAGTNRTLNQQVVFSWNFVGSTNQADAFKTQAVAGALKTGPADAAQLQNSPINGRLRLGAGKEMEINATPAAK